MKNWRPTPLAALLVVGNVAAYLFQTAQGPAGQEWIFVHYGVIPAVLLHGERFAIPGVPEPYAITLLTSSFLHGGLSHLAVNMAFVAVVGTVVERAIGTWRLLVLWIGAVLLGGTAHALVNSESLNPTIGASAGVAGLIGVVAAGGWIGLVAGALWVVLQVVGALGQASEAFGTYVAWSGHLGGFAAGMMGGMFVRWEIRRRRRALKAAGPGGETPRRAPSPRDNREV